MVSQRVYGLREPRSLHRPHSAGAGRSAVTFSSARPPADIIPISPVKVGFTEVAQRSSFKAAAVSPIAPERLRTKLKSRPPWRGQNNDPALQWSWIHP